MSACFDGTAEIATDQCEIMIYLPATEDTDTLTFIHIKMQGFLRDTLHVVVPGFALQVQEPSAQQFSINKEYIVMAFWKNILLLKRDGDQRLVFQGFLPMAESFSYLQLVGDKIVIGRCYNYNPKDAASPTMLTMYDLSTRLFEKPIYPVFQSIEFTYFKPLHTIDANSKWVAFAQTQSYDVTLYDQKLHTAGRIQRKVEDWKLIDTSFIKSVVAKKLNPRGAIAELDSVEQISSRLESIDFLDDSTLAVRFIPPNGNRFPRVRRFDIWSLNGGEWKLAQADMLDRSPNQDSILWRGNFPLGSGYGNCQYCVTGNHRLVNSRFMAAIPQLGRSVKDIRKASDDYNAKYDPELHLLVYSIE